MSRDFTSELDVESARVDFEKLGSVIEKLSDQLACASRNAAHMSSVFEHKSFETDSPLRA